MAVLQLSPPYNWCDHVCERCPLAVECPVAGAERARSKTDALLAGAMAPLAEAVRLLEEIAKEQGISLDLLEPLPPPMLDAEVLVGAARAYGHALRELRSDERAVGLSILVELKIARIAGYLSGSPDALEGAVWAMDAAPNLLLVERTLDELADATAVRDSTALDTCERTLRGLVGPLLASIPASVRVAVAALASAGRAPSPFCSGPPPARNAS